MNLILKRTTKLVKHAASFMRSRNIEVSEKQDPANLVTNIDVAIQKYLEKHLLKLLPGSSIFAEEKENNLPDEKFVWCVDPIDGTTNFARQFSLTCISVALIEDGEVVLGVVYSPFTRELFTALKGKGAYLNGKKITVSDKQLKQSIFCTSLCLYEKKYSKICSDILLDIYENVADFRRTGSCAMELCYIAAGRFDLYFEINVQPWDYAAASLILFEAGGYFQSIGNSDNFFKKPLGVMAGNSKQNLEQLSEIVYKHINEV